MGLVRTLHHRRAASISRLSIHLQAIEQLSNMLQDNISEPPPISKPILSMVYVAFTDAKCIDMATEETVRLGSATLADHSRTMESAEEIIKVVSKGCSLPFLISIKIETTRGVDNRTEGNLLLIDFGSPSFQNLPDRSPASLPHTLSIIRELASLIVTPGAAGELPILQSPFTSLVPELFGGSAISLYILNVDIQVSDPSCNATDVQPALELYDSMRKIRNQTNVKRGSTHTEGRVDANAQQGLDMNGMKCIMSIGKATNASYRVESAIKDEMLRQENSNWNTGEAGIGAQSLNKSKDDFSTELTETNHACTTEKDLGAASQTISRCKDLEAQLEWAKLDHSKAAEALSQLQSDLASNHMEDKWNSRLQQSILTLEAKAKEAASNRVNEVELLKETLMLHEGATGFVQAALEQRAEWNDQKSALLALIAPKATENASEAAQKVPHLPLSERSGEAVPILTPADSEPIAKSDSKKVSKKSTTKTTSKEVISKDKNLKSAANRVENNLQLKSTDSLERNSDGESSFDISIDEDISVELVSAPKTPTTKAETSWRYWVRYATIRGGIEDSSEESLAKTDVDDADTGVAVDKREVLKPVTTTKSGANSKRKPNIKAKSDRSVEIAHNPAKSSKKRKMSSGTLKPSEAPENGVIRLQTRTVSLSGLLSFLSKGKENDAVSDSSTA
ncbi:hypothetical protein BSLG_009395 [Batrachochytrium salamandrivorans]|nr:hypothetical protein BSLG_009395 [Batrachochytrium salamandrivorans]